jgi:hypothetical protein
VVIARMFSVMLLIQSIDAFKLVNNLLTVPLRYISIGSDDLSLMIQVST